MKKLLLVVTLALGLISSANAQPVGFGIKAGADFTTGSNVFNLGLNGGAFAVFSLAESIEFQPELQFIQKGFETHSDDVPVLSGPTIVGYTGVDYRLTLSYLEIPLVFNFHTPLGPGWDGNLQVGPTMAFLLSGNTYSNGGSYGSSNHDVTNEYASFEAGFLLGAGLRAGNWLLDGRYERGLTSVDKNAGIYGSVNSLFTLQVGYQLF
jgi:hypothetical protein